MTNAYDIVVTGSYFCDLVFTGLPSLPQLGAELVAPQFDLVLGGGAPTTAITLQRLGVNVGLATELGSDLFSDFAAERLAAEGIDMALIVRSPEAMRRITVSLSYPTDRAFVTYVDPAPSRIERAARVLDNATFRHLHFPGLIIAPALIPLLDQCRAREISVSMDCQYRQETLTSTPEVAQILSRLDLFMPNETEALRLTTAATLAEAVAMLADLTPCVVIKRGADGAIARRGGIDYAAAAVPCTVLDTTGAGDAFNAGFLAAYLEDQPIADCLRWGNFCGAMSVQGVGGTATAPTRAQLSAWLAE